MGTGVTDISNFGLRIAFASRIDCTDKKTDYHDGELVEIAAPIRSANPTGQALCYVRLRRTCNDGGSD